MRKGFNEISIVCQAQDGAWWEVFEPKRLYPVRFTRWTQAINYAQKAGAVYANAPETPMAEFTPDQAKVMINRKNTK